ncbi:MAG: sigma-70 family RNA polymerase sigma factor [Caulobacteraceae bacterium]|nr:sigma-70 family RNA polymerase sigma factor [Caulobacteraceae bacterium]
MSAIDLAELFQRNYEDIRLFILKRVPTPEDAADLAQEAFLRLLRRGEGVMMSARGYLFATALNLVRDQMRAKAARPECGTAADLENVADAAPRADAHSEYRDALRILELALSELSPTRRSALLLHRLDGLSHAAVAEALGLSVSSVEKHIRFALRHCNVRLADAGVLAEPPAKKP